MSTLETLYWIMLIASETLVTTAR